MMPGKEKIEMRFEEQAAALARKVQSIGAPVPEDPDIPRILSGEKPFPMAGIEEHPHALATLARQEAVPRVTAEMDALIRGLAVPGEEREHEQAKARIRTDAKKRTLRRGFASRTPESTAIISRAAQEAGRNNRLFCEFMHRDHVPVPAAWGVRTWLEAWEKKALRPKIRSFKRRYKSTA